VVITAAVVWVAAVDRRTVNGDPLLQNESLVSAKSIQNITDVLGHTWMVLVRLSH